MSLTKREKEAGYKSVPQPTEHDAKILRRVAKGFLLVTLGKNDNGETVTRYCYDDGTPICDQKGRHLSTRAVNRMIRQHWLLPVKGESLWGDGPPQRYRARTVDDGPLPRFMRR